jgi:hypothetical protein
VFIPPIYFTGYVGPFPAYPPAAYAIAVAPSRDNLAIQKWRNNITAQAPAAPDDPAVVALHQHVIQHGRIILLFADHATFKAWQRALAEVQP